MPNVTLNMEGYLFEFYQVKARMEHKTCEQVMEEMLQEIAWEITKEAYFEREEKITGDKSWRWAFLFEEI